MKNSVKKLIAMQLLMLMAIVLPVMRFTYAKTEGAKMQIVSEPIFFQGGNVLAMSNGLELTIIDDKTAEESFKKVLTLDEYIAMRMAPAQADAEDDARDGNAADEGPDIPPSPYKVSLYSNEQPHMNEGYLLNIWAELDGFENKNVTMQWRYVDENGVWGDIKGANSMRYTVPLTQKIMGYGCCLVVTVD